MVDAGLAKRKGCDKSTCACIWNIYVLKGRRQSSSNGLLKGIETNQELNERSVTH